MDVQCTFALTISARMELFLYSIGSLALAIGGYALMRFSNHLSVLYELKSDQQQEAMSMDTSSIIAWAVWLPMMIFAIGCNCVGGIMLAFGVVQFVARLFGLGMYS